MLKPSTHAIKIIEDMCSSPYNNSRDKRIMKRGISQVETDESQTELGKKMQALSLKIETLKGLRLKSPPLHLHYQPVINVELCIGQEKALLMMS